LAQPLAAAGPGDDCYATHEFRIARHGPLPVYSVMDAVMMNCGLSVNDMNSAAACCMRSLETPLHKAFSSGTSVISTSWQGDLPPPSRPWGRKPSNFSTVGRLLTVGISVELAHASYAATSASVFRLNSTTILVMNPPPCRKWGQKGVFQLCRESI